MSRLNTKTEVTKKVIHIMTTSLCNRDCKYCCNKQYSLDEVPYVTHEELNEVETICLTGGEPFLFTNPCEMASYYKHRYKNIKNIYVYTNALELAQWIKKGNHLHDIDGVNVSIKTKADVVAFKTIIKDNVEVLGLTSNLLYVFDDLYNEMPIGFKTIKREWQQDFVPATDSIFRRN